MSKPVLFASFRPLTRAENLNAIYTAYPGEKKHIHTYDVDFRREVLSGKYDIMVIDEFPSVTPGKCIMIWHGIQGGKYIGLDQPNRPYYRHTDARKMTHIISASEGMRSTWSRCTGVPYDDILPLGMPRTDELFTHTKYKQDPDKRTYLFAPTFRDYKESAFPKIDWAYIDEHLTDDECLLVKAHPWYMFQAKINRVEEQLTGVDWKHIRIVGADLPTTPFLYDADVVITDYSSIMFDAYLLNIPVVLFEKYPGYTETRGMYLRYPDQYCSRFATTEEELLVLLRSSAGLNQVERDCRALVASACDGHSCERISALIDSMKGE